MDFKQVIPLIIEGFTKEKVRYALIGGFAMAALGLSRNTEDVDFLIDKQDLAKVDTVLKYLNYQCVFTSEREIADIEDLISRFYKTIDWDLVEKYFLLFEKHDLFLKFKGKYGSV